MHKLAEVVNYLVLVFGWIWLGLLACLLPTIHAQASPFGLSSYAHTTRAPPRCLSSSPCAAARVFFTLFQTCTWRGSRFAVARGTGAASSLHCGEPQLAIVHALHAIFYLAAVADTAK